MVKDDIVQELRKDIKIMKKDLRAISIKTRSMARVLEVGSEGEDLNNKKMKETKKSSWLDRIFLKIITWLMK